jgi:hypothetical protein
VPHERRSSVLQGEGGDAVGKLLFERQFRAIFFNG